MEGMKSVVKMSVLLVVLASLGGSVQAQSLKGCKLSANKYDPDSTSNPYGRCGSRYSPDSINNPYGKFGSPYSPSSVHNPYATDAPRIVAPDGTDLGRLSTNQYDPDSTSNPYGVHGSEYSPTSINNRFSPYGSKFGSESVHNPYTLDSPKLIEPGTNPGPIYAPPSLPKLPTLPKLPSLPGVAEGYGK